MMNLSINLTLGSPGADSVLNSAVAPEDEPVDSFSLKLADELSEQELTPSLLLDDTKAVDPVLLEAIAARQKLAADAEASSAAAGRDWVDDPLIGLPEAEDTEIGLVDTLVEDKPWFDIIEKAKSYGPALQANKATLENTAESVAMLQDHALIGAADLAELPLVDAAALLANSEMANDAISAAVSDAEPFTPVSLPSPSDATRHLAATSPSVMSTASEQIAQLPSAAEMAQPVLNPESAEAQQKPLVANNSTSNVTAAVIADEASTQSQAAVGIQHDSAGNSNNLGPEKANNMAGQLAVDNQSGQSVSKTHEQSVAATGADLQQTAEISALNAGVLPEAESHLKDPAAKTTHAPQLPHTAHKPAVNDAITMAQAVETDPLQQATMLTEAASGSNPATRATSAVSTGAEKAPASNAFAEHMKSVNQAQQQQQQSGSEQQPGQGQAKAPVEAMLTQPTTQPAATVTNFVQQLQQLQQPAETAGSSTPVAPSVSHSAATHSSHHALATARPTDLPAWQAPLALTEPAAAQQLKDRVMVQIQQKLQTAEVQLHPEDLGSMQIKLNLQQDQLSVQFVVQQSVAKEALEQQMPKLRELLEQQGIALSEGQVEQRQSGSQQEQRQARSGQSAGDESDLKVTQSVQMKVSDRMVDFYA